MEKYYVVGNKICVYYFVYIIEDNHEEKVMVHEDDLNGFLQCLKHFGFRW